MVLIVLGGFIFFLSYLYVVNMENNSDTNNDSDTLSKTESTNIQFSFSNLDDARRFENKKRRSAIQNGVEVVRPKSDRIGYIYIASTGAYIGNQCINCVKIGYTSRNPRVRINELEKENEFTTLDQMNLMPMYPNHKFTLKYSFKTKGAYDVEQITHKELRDSEKWLWGELFEITPEDAKDIILSTINEVDECELIE